MNNGGIGVGSASIVLVFAVLCLTVFSLITFVVAGNDKALVDTEAQLILGYYEADAFAEHIVSDIMEKDAVPNNVRGIKVETAWDEDIGADVVSYLCPVTDKKALSVKLIIDGDSYSVLCWRMKDTEKWESDDSLNVWSGDE